MNNVFKINPAWKPFLCEWDADDGDRFGFTIYAMSFSHADQCLEELKRTARVLGEHVESLPGPVV